MLSDSHFANKGLCKD